jgi:hypothetical protein
MASFIDTRTTVPFTYEVKLNLYGHVYNVSSGVKIIDVLEEISASLDTEDFTTRTVHSKNLNFHKHICDGVKCFSLKNPTSTIGARRQNSAAISRPCFPASPLESLVVTTRCL